MMAIYDPKKSLDLLMSGDLPENEALNHLDMLTEVTEFLSYKLEVFKPGKHLYDGQEIEAYQDGGRWWIDKPGFKWTGETAAIIAVFKAWHCGKTDLLKNAIMAGNTHIFDLDISRKFICSILTEKYNQKWERQIRNMDLVKKTRALNKLMGIPIESVKESAIGILTNDEEGIKPNVFLRKVYGKRKK
jgi:hypothetical protein